MSSISDDILTYFNNTGLIGSYTKQYGEWLDDGKSSYFVIIPDGGSQIQPWIREPNYRVIIVGKKAHRPFTTGGVGNLAESLVAYIRDNQSSPLHQQILTTEPMPPLRTESGRYMITFSLMTKLAV